MVASAGEGACAGAAEVARVALVRMMPIGLVKTCSRRTGATSMGEQASLRRTRPRVRRELACSPPSIQ